ncbi:MAG: putative DNA binding domain-containing protein [Desulfovibrio sp.]|nr:putative DNA binding domain-containing protein [Desulfovibrio sp.]
MQITEQDLRLLIADMESARVERTLTATKKDKLGEAVCAFANDISGEGKPGCILVGVADDGTIEGTHVDDALLRSLAELRNDGSVLPKPSLQVEKREIDGKQIIVVSVMPSIFPPVRYKGIVWIRTGPTRSRATEQDERILVERRIASAQSFDAAPCPDAALDDLSINEFLYYRSLAVASDIIDENNRSLANQLASLRLYNNKTACPTFAGILLLSPDPRQWLSSAYIQFLRFAGTELDEPPISAKEIGGNLSTMLRQLDDIINIHINERTIPVSTLRETAAYDYPAWALRELLLNAVMHKNYESTQPVRFYWFADRIEIHNPGGLYGEACINFPKNNAYRNPVIAEILKNMGYVNRYGYGIARATKLLHENGNPPPDFQLQINLFGVTIRST